MKAAVLFSGGKDSTLALFQVLQAGFDVKYLVSIYPKNDESYMFHHPNIRLTKLLAESMGIPIKTKVTKGKKEEELDDLEHILSKISSKIDVVVTGAVASKYQKSRIEKICIKLGVGTFSPLWGIDPKRIWKMCLDNGFGVMLSAVACAGLGEGWLGEVITKDTYKELKALSEKYKFHIGGEGGEFETLVVDCPLYKIPIVTKKGVPFWDKETESGHISIEMFLPESEKS